MAIKMISVENEDRVREYTCLPTDARGSYPNDCEKGSKMTILNAVTGLPSAELIFNGVEFMYSNELTSSEDIVNLSVVPMNVLDFHIDMKDRMYKRVFMEMNSTGVLTVSIANVPRDTTIQMIIDYKETATSVTFFGSITPTLIKGKKYIIEAVTYNGGTNYLADIREY